jgi:Arc/MetJ-type ribon-helix-helix transcriptional regulator
MAKINFRTTPTFDADLRALMDARKLGTKSEAIRLAVREAAAKLQPRRHDLSALIGFVDSLPGGRRTRLSGAQLLAELDAEMEESLSRRSKRGGRDPL